MAPQSAISPPLRMSVLALSINVRMPSEARNETLAKSTTIALLRFASSSNWESTSCAP